MLQGGSTAYRTPGRVYRMTQSLTGRYLLVTYMHEAFPVNANYLPLLRYNFFLFRKYGSSASAVPRKTDFKAGANTGLAVDRNPPVVLVNNFFGEQQAVAGPHFSVGAGCRFLDRMVKNRF